MGSSRTRNSTRAARARSKNDQTPHPYIPADVAQAIERERRRLQKASSVLTCLIFAASHEAHDIDAADVASVVRDLIDYALAALDSAKLSKGTKATV